MRPDGYGVWAEGGSEVAFFLEHDRGTETHDRLVAKLDGYATMASASTDRFWDLFWFPGRKRETAARKAFAGAGVSVASGCQGDPPDGAVWLPVGTAGARRRLAELPGALRAPAAAR